MSHFVVYDQNNLKKLMIMLNGFFFGLKKKIFLDFNINLFKEDISFFNEYKISLNNS
jgi:hypothetical protein